MIYICILYKAKIPKDFFPRARPCGESSSGRADDGAVRRGVVRAGRKVSWDRGADPHTWTSALQQGVPPYREQTDCLQMTLLPLQMLPQPPPRRACWPMTVVRRWLLYAPAVETSSADRIWDVVWPPTLRGT